MGPAPFADVASLPFWAFVATATVVLGLFGRDPSSRNVLALLNLAFCALMVGAVATTAIAVALLSLHYACQSPRATVRQAGIPISGLLLGIAFFAHKLPFATSPAIEVVKPILAGIGFSYIALRGVEYLRAAFEGSNRDLRLADTVNYLIPFHMLTAGPIMAFADYRRHLTATNPPSSNSVLEGTERIARGLFKKFVLASGLIDTIFLTDFRAGGFYFFVEVQLYYLFIYLDFSAYTDIAIGIGQLIGVATPENFDRPLRARNIIEFWERWHMSLSQFIRRNIFIPIQLQGMRWTEGRGPLWIASIAYLVTFVACGLWHGLSWRFVIWGALHALALIACTLYRRVLVVRLGRQGAATYMANPIVRLVSTTLTFEFVAFSLVLIAHPATAFLE